MADVKNCTSFGSNVSRQNDDSFAMMLSTKMLSTGKICPLPPLHCQFPLNLRVELVVPLELQSTIGLDLQAEAGLTLPGELCRRYAADIFTSDAEWALDFHYAIRRLQLRIMDKAISRCTKKAHGVIQGQTTWLNSQPSVTDAVHV